jgi:circadian clock protein KaiC
MSKGGTSVRTRSDASAGARRISTGIEGLDAVLGGGLTPERLYLVEGTPGTGKTTLALQFLLDGSEPGMYITLSETSDELRAVAASHGWSLEKISIFELVGESGLDEDAEQSILHPSEVELGETTQRIFEEVRRLKPSKIVFDSLSEMRLLAQNPLRYRRQILALKHFFSSTRSTVLMLDDRTSEPGDLQLHSIAHGVITLEQTTLDVGAERRRLRVVKMRGIKFRGGYHDLLLDTGGITTYPRLVVSDHRAEFEAEDVSTGLAALDQLMGGGLRRGSNTLLIGPSGVGKTTTAVRCMLAALERGERAAFFLFDEGRTTLLGRCAALNMDIRPYLDSGQLTLYQIDPSELSPGEFSARVRHCVEEDGARFVIIDSLNAYLQAMPGEKFLLLQMHELLMYLNQQGILTLLVLGQHGLVGDVRADVDLSYLSDTIVLFRFFESRGELLKAISVVKSRTNPHEQAIRQFRLNEHGLTVGEALRDFDGVMSGVSNYRGETELLGAAD